MVNDKNVMVKEPFDFPTAYNKKTYQYVSESGDEYLVTYEYSMVKNVKQLVENGKTNVYQLIQAERDAVDINKLIARYESGEKDVLDRVHGQYFDVVDFPKNFAEMQQRLIAAENHFMSLDPEVREAFNNNPIEFYDQYGSKEFDAKLEKLFPKEFSQPFEPDVNSIKEGEDNE